MAKKLRVFDFDDTLAKTRSFVYVTHGDGSESELTPAEFALYQKKEGDELSEISLLKSIYKEEKYKLISKRKMLEKEGTKKQYSCIFFYKEYDLEEKINLKSFLL